MEVLATIIIIIQNKAFELLIWKMFMALSIIYMYWASDS